LGIYFVWDIKSGGMKKFIWLSIGIFFSINLAAQDDRQKRYTKVPGGYLMVLRQGDSIINRIEELAVKENIPSAGFTGLGFAGYVKFGFFDAQTKQFIPKEIRDVELAGINGSIAWENNKPSIHLHAVAGDKNLQSYSGHVLSAAVGTGSVEIMITVYTKKLQRKKDAEIGANVLEVE